MGHLISVSMASKKAAKDQSSLGALGDRHLHPPRGACLKSTPCRQQCRPFQRQAARLQEKLRVQTRSLKR